MKTPSTTAKKELEPAPIQQYDYFTFLNDNKAVVIIDISGLKNRC